MSAHEEILVKVNAWVDRGVVPLVQALNEFESVITVDSCQGRDGGHSYVYFKHCGPERARFFHDFAQKLGEQAPMAKCDYDFSLQWLTGHLEPMAKISSPPASVDRLAELLSSVASGNHTNRSGGGT